MRRRVVSTPVLIIVGLTTAIHAQGRREALEADLQKLESQTSEEVERAFTAAQRTLHPLARCAVAAEYAARRYLPSSEPSDKEYAKEQSEKYLLEAQRLDQSIKKTLYSKPILNYWHYPELEKLFEKHGFSTNVPRDSYQDFSLGETYGNIKTTVEQEFTAWVRTESNKYCGFENRTMTTAEWMNCTGSYGEHQYIEMNCDLLGSQP